MNQISSGCQRIYPKPLRYKTQYLDDSGVHKGASQRHDNSCFDPIQDGSKKPVGQILQ